MMKYLLITFLIPLSSFSSVRVEVQRNNGIKYGGEFETVSEAQLWIDENNRNHSFGKLDRWEQKKAGETCPGAERESVGPIGGTIVECFHWSEFTVCGKNPGQLNIEADCEDITAEIQLKKDKKLEEESTLTEIKTSSESNTLKLEEVRKYMCIKEGWICP